MRLTPFISCLALAAGMATAQNINWDTSLTDLQRHRVYPYLDKAYRLEQQQQYQAALAELDKALTIVPVHPPFLQLRVKWQLASASLPEAAESIRLLPPEEQSVLFSAWLDTLLQSPELNNHSMLTQLYQQSSSAQRQQMAIALSQRFIALDQQQLAYDWLSRATELNAEQQLQKARLEEALGKKAEALRTYQHLYQQQQNEQVAQGYCLALLQAGQSQQALQLAATAPKQHWAASCYRQQLQQSLAANEWQAALDTAALLQQHHSLSAAEQKQLYQAALNAGQLKLAKSFIKGADTSCLQQVLMYEQTGETGLAKTAFFRCSPHENPAQYLQFAALWLSAAQLQHLQITGATNRALQQQLVQQRQIKEGRHQQLLEQLFSRPLTAKDKTLLLSSIQALPIAAQRLPYLEKAYQQWPELPVLNQLSLLYIELSQPEQALMLLSNSLPWHGKAQLQQELTMRLLNVLHLAPTERQQAILSQLDNSPWYREQRAELWRLNQRCDKAISLLNPAPEQVRGWRTLALCESSSRPTYAIQYWQQLQQLAPASDNIRQLVYLYEQQQQYDLALQHALQLTEGERTAADLLKMAELALRLNQRQQALNWLQQMPDGTEFDSKKYSMLARLYQQTGEQQAAGNAWQQAYQAAPVDPQLQADYGFFLLSTAPERAAPLLQQAAKHPDNSHNSHLKAQLAYLYQQLEQEQDTAHWAQAAAADSTDVMHNAEHLAIQRLHQQLSSPWQLSIGASLADSAVPGATATVPLLQQQKYNTTVQLGYMLDKLQQDLNLFAMLGSGGQHSWSDTQGAQLGVRYKPLLSHNIWLSAALEKVPLQQSQWQPQLRLSADLFNLPPWQHDWRPDTARWQERRLFTDLVWWPDSGQQQAQLRYEQALAWKLPTTSAQGFGSYWLSQYDYRKLNDSNALSQQLWSTGLGINWRHWSGQALHQRIEVSAEWRFNLDGDKFASRHAWFLQVSTAW